MPQDMTQSLVYSAVVLIVGVILLSQFAGLGGGGTATGEARLAANAEIDPAVRELTGVQETLGTAVQFDGSNGAGLSGEIPQPPPGEAELCTFAALTTAGDGGAPERNVTIVNADGQLAIEYHGNRSTPQWVATRFDAATRQTAAVSAPATAPTTLRHVCARDTGGTLVLNVNGSDVASAPVAGGGSALLAESTQPAAATVEETRLYTTTLNTTQRTTIRTSPTAPAAGVQPSARLYYDTRVPVGNSVSSVPIYFAGTVGDLEGATVVNGAAGRPASTGDIVLERGGTQARAAPGSQLDGNPVAFISYESPGLIGGTGQRVLSTLEAAFELAPVALIILVSGAILRIIQTES